MIQISFQFQSAIRYTFRGILLELPFQNLHCVVYPVFIVHKDLGILLLTSAFYFPQGQLLYNLVLPSFNKNKLISCDQSSMREHLYVVCYQTQVLVLFLIPKLFAKA